MTEWRVFWVGPDWLTESDSPGAEWSDWGMRVGDAVFVGPDYRVDPLLCRFGQSSAFRGYEQETKRNYATDISLLLAFLSRRGRHWTDAREKDLNDFRSWRLDAPANPDRVGNSKSNRELAAFAALYKWAKREKYVPASPVTMRQVSDLHGGTKEVPDGLRKAAPSDMHWLTPRTWRLWMDIGLRGHTRAGVVEPGWLGRVEDRNTAFVRLLVSSGLRRQEGGSLLTFEVPGTRLGGSRYCRGRVSGAVTRSKASRTFYCSTEAVRDIESYVESSRAWAVRKAQVKGRYDKLTDMRLVTEVTRGPKRKVRWTARDGVVFEQLLDSLTWRERATLFTEGPDGPEPLWLWLNEAGLPFQPHSWDAVFRTANQRCRAALEPPAELRADPHKVYSPYATVHGARHSMALFMLVVLNSLMDQRFGLSPSERRDFALLYGDPWHLVQGLLGHATRQVTVDTYLAPVRHLQLQSLLAEVEEPLSAPLPDLDDLFARVAREADGIQDIDVRLAPVLAGAAS
ncbi:site-specific integrase [Kitasatospora purpeofusca]|uniref:site-specific integrase n=1 Tax=Kitasatospora purpeofusca TaxID=67352 RepID=UPI00225A9DB2|nr:site-specific integrase [Kitasatospora purpeofusca]MCX4757843.1 site-specific integrase [Kitasatospora purpeofusca]WSR34464.1 site-specific integrase [Kitasatospora purpeofusca]